MKTVSATTKTKIGLKHLASVVITALLLMTVNQAGYASEIRAGNNQPLQNISWTDKDGGKHHLKDSNGKPRLLHFWAAWCISCRAELPEMLAWQKENKDFVIIPLSLDERMAQAKYFIKKYQLDMAPLLLDDDSADELDIPALPYTMLVSSEGRLIGYIYGAASWDDGFTSRLKQQFNID